MLLNVHSIGVSEWVSERVGFYGTATLYRLYGAETGEKLPDPHLIYIRDKNMGYGSRNLTPAGESEMQKLFFSFLKPL